MPGEDKRDVPAVSNFGEILRDLHRDAIAKVNLEGPLRDGSKGVPLIAPCIWPCQSYKPIVQPQHGRSRRNNSADFLELRSLARLQKSYLSLGHPELANKRIQNAIELGPVLF